MKSCSFCGEDTSNESAMCDACREKFPPDHFKKIVEGWPFKDVKEQAKTPRQPASPSQSA